jgi:hypothetical protein
VLLAGSMVLAGLLWLLPINWYEIADGFHACDPDGLGISEGILVVGLVLLAGAVILVLVDAGAGKRRRRILLASSAALLACHLARVPELLREEAWTSTTCDVSARMDK